MHKLYSSWHTYKKEMEAQKHSFQIELGQGIEKMKQLEVKSKILKKKIRALRLSKQIAVRSFPTLVKAVTVSSNSNQDKRVEG